MAKKKNATTKTATSKNATTKTATSKGKGAKPAPKKKSALKPVPEMKDHLREETARLEEESQRTTTTTATQQVDEFDTGSVASGKGSWIKPVAITLSIVFGLILMLVAVKIMFPGLGQVTTITAPAPVVAPAPAVVTPAPAVVAPAPAVVTPAPAVVAPAPAVVTPAPAMQLPQGANVSATPNGTSTTPTFDGWEKVTINKAEQDIPEGLQGLMKIYKGFSDVQTLNGKEVRYMLTQAPGAAHPTYTRGPLPPAEHFLPTPDGFTRFSHDANKNIVIER